MSVIIRFGYCPPNPGPKKKLKNKWYYDINQSIDEYDGRSETWVSYNNQRYRKITFEQLIKLNTYDTDQTRSV